MSLYISRKLNDVLVSWVTFPKAEFCISGLKLADNFAREFCSGIFVNYFTEVFGLNLREAAKLENIKEGFSCILVVVATCISDAYLGLFRMIVIATVLHIIGLGLACTAAYLDSSRSILYVTLSFLVLGTSGINVTLEAFMSDQHGTSSDHPKLAIGCFMFIRRLVTVIFPMVTLIVWMVLFIVVPVLRNHEWIETTLIVLMVLFIVVPVLRNLEWKETTLIATVMMFAGLVCFLLGNSVYTKTEPTGCPLTSSFWVFKAAILKRHLKYPTMSNQFYENERDNNVLLPAVPLFRWLDKAAILESSSISTKELETNGKLCTVTQVTEVKRLLTMIPIWTVFFVYSLVGAAGSTFFFEQATFLNDFDISGNKSIPIMVFVLFTLCGSIIASTISGRLLPRFQFFQTRQRLAILVRIGLGMVCSIFCCFISWSVENYRLSNDSQISAIWLSPQFILLGCMKNFAGEGLEDFSNTQVSESMEKYGSAFSQFILGIGKFISAILIVIFKDCWFGEDIDSSHLNRYYEFLAWLSLLNFFIFVRIAAGYGDNHTRIENLDEYYNSKDGFLDQSVSPLNKSNSFPQRSHRPKWSFQSFGRLTQRHLTINIGGEKEVEPNGMRSTMNKDLPV